MAKNIFFAEKLCKEPESFFCKIASKKIAMCQVWAKVTGLSEEGLILVNRTGFSHEVTGFPKTATF